MATALSACVEQSGGERKDRTDIERLLRRRASALLPLGLTQPQKQLPFNLLVIDDVGLVSRKPWC